MNSCGSIASITRTFTCVACCVSADMYSADCSFLRRHYRSKRDALRHRERQQKTHDSRQKGEKLKQKLELQNLQSQSSSPDLSAATIEAHPKPSPQAANFVRATQPPANGRAHFTSGSGSCASPSEARQGLIRFPFALATVPSLCAYEYGNGTLVQQPQPHQQQWANLCYSPVAQYTQQYTYSQWPPAAQSCSDLQSLSSSTTWPFAH